MVPARAKWGVAHSAHGGLWTSTKLASLKSLNANSIITASPPGYAGADELSMGHQWLNGVGSHHPTRSTSYVVSSCESGLLSAKCICSAHHIYMSTKAWGSSPATSSPHGT